MWGSKPKLLTPGPSQETSADSRGCWVGIMKTGSWVSIFLESPSPSEGFSLQPTHASLTPNGCHLEGGGTTSLLFCKLTGSSWLPTPQPELGRFSVGFCLFPLTRPVLSFERLSCKRGFKCYEDHTTKHRAHGSLSASIVHHTHPPPRPPISQALLPALLASRGLVPRAITAQAWHVLPFPADPTGGPALELGVGGEDSSDSSSSAPSLWEKGDQTTVRGQWDGHTGPLGGGGDMRPC